MGSLDRKVLFGCIAALAVFLGVGCFSYYKTQDFMETSRQLMQIHQITEDYVGILKDISDAKSGQRDFILTGKDAFLQSCQDSLFSIDAKVQDIEKLGRNGSGGQSKLEVLNTLLAQQINFFKKTIAARRDGGFSQAVQMIQGAEGMESMDRIHQLVVDLQGDEKELAQRQEWVMQVKSMEINRAFWIGFCGDSLLLLMVYLMIHGEMKGRLKAEKELSEKSGMLGMVLNNMKDGVIAADSSGRFGVVNPAAQKLFGISDSPMPTLDRWQEKVEIRRPDGRTPYPAGDLPLARVLQGQECENEEIFICHDEFPEGLFLSVNGRPLRDKDGVIIGGITVYTDVTEKKRNEKLILRDNQTLKHSLEKMEQHNQEITMLVGMLESLQACMSVEEVAQTTLNVMQSMFPETSGCVMSMNLAKGQIEKVAGFGPEFSTKETFPLDECWAMRRHQAHLVDTVESTMLCKHLAGPPPQEYLCVPLAAQGTLVGMIHMSSRKPGSLGERQKKLLVLIGEQVALAFANLGVRETLQNQSIRDPLTGLFNRRYMEQVLEKEVGAAVKNSHKLSALMIDIDHFKQFNDKHGHEAGDLVLREVGTLLNQSIRKGDVACRYGGEELVLIFPETEQEDARRLACKVQESVKGLSLRHLNDSLETVTVSVGVAVCPDDGKTVAEVLRAADIALYHAKASGRDRVVSWKDIHPNREGLPEEAAGSDVVHSRI